MKRRRCKHIWRRLDKKILGLILLATGIAIVAITILPYHVWMVLVGCGLVYAGYKLFI